IKEFNLIVKSTLSKYPIKQAQLNYVPDYIANMQNEAIYYIDLRHNRAHHIFLADIQNQIFQQTNEPTLKKLRDSPSIFSQPINFLNQFTECLSNNVKKYVKIVDKQSNENTGNQKYFIRRMLTNQKNEKIYQIVIYLAGEITFRSQKILKEKGKKILVIKYQNNLSKYGLDEVAKDQCGKNVINFNIPTGEQEIQLAIKEKDVTKLKDINYSYKNKGIHVFTVIFYVQL
ncbi:hypothetical protein ABPG72_014546, partial [Tetrahymena utriculariae]